MAPHTAAIAACRAPARRDAPLPVEQPELRPDERHRRPTTAPHYPPQVQLSAGLRRVAQAAQQPQLVHQAVAGTPVSQSALCRSESAPVGPVPTTGTAQLLLLRPHQL
jgi:hypothetical protein